MSTYGVMAHGGCSCNAIKGDPHERGCISKLYFIVKFGTASGKFTYQWIGLN